MSAQQPKALQLADCLETDQEHLPISRSEIAAELRRLHTETANQQDWYTEWQKWEHASKNFERQRDELLEALKACDEAMSYMSEYDIPITLPAQVKAAIAKAIR